MKILKFGGAALADGEKISHVAGLIKNYSEKERIVVVVSAMGGITDLLISLFHKFKDQKLNNVMEILNTLYLKHFNALEDLQLNTEQNISIEKSFRQVLGELLISLTLKKEFSLWDYDYIVSFGERLSSLLMAKALQKRGVLAKPVDSSYLMVTTSEFGSAKALLRETKEMAEMIILPLIHKGIVPVITGFYGATKDGRIAILGRGGSDYSATIFAHALDAREVILWKEVDGVFSADPKGGKAKFYNELSYRKALLLSQNGAKVLHKEAIKPVMEKEIVVWVKNVFKPDFSGTKIWKGTR